MEGRFQKSPLNKEWGGHGNGDGSSEGSPSGHHNMPLSCMRDGKGNSMLSLLFNAPTTEMDTCIFYHAMQQSKGESEKENKSL